MELDPKAVPTQDDLSKDQQTSEDVVKYDTYKRVLADHKKSKAMAEEYKAKLDALETKEKEQEEKRLNEQGEYKKLLELERKKSASEEAKRKEYESNLLDAHKLNAVKEKLPAKIKRPEYYNFIDTEKIVIDRETGQIDETSLESVVNDFLTNHSVLLELDKKTNLPQNAAGGSGAKLSYDDWLKLPLKEKRKRIKDVKE